jgi:hypothetical protein
MLSIRCKLTMIVLTLIATNHVVAVADEPIETVVKKTSAIAAAQEQSKEQQELNKLVAEAIKVTSRRFLTADVHTPWQIMHGILALRDSFKIKVDGQKISALDWLAKGQEFRGASMIERTLHGGRFHRFTKPYHFEGHPNQFLAILTMSELATDFKLNTSTGEGISITQMLENAKQTVNDREEITWTLWSLARYLPIDSEWINAANEPWSIERLVQIQTYAEPNDAACGGTHGLFALSIARNAYVFSGKPLRGIWLEADQKIKRYIAESKALQNSDGTFSTVYFTGPGQSSEFSKRIASSGHILEFLMVALSDKQLQDAWVQKAINAVAKDLVDHRQDAADCGPLYHALHALVLYQQRTGQDVLAEINKPKPNRVANAKADTTPSEKAATPAKATSAKTGNKGSKTTTTVTESIPTSTKAVKPPTTIEQPLDQPKKFKLPSENTKLKTLKQVLDGAPLSNTQTVTPRQDVIVIASRSPEDNAPIIRTSPVIMDDGYEVPLPPTSD